MWVETWYRSYSFRVFTRSSCETITFIYCSLFRHKNEKVNNFQKNRVIINNYIVFLIKILVITTKL